MLLNLKNSKKHLREALKYIPLGGQTFSKSHLLFDKNFFPLFSSGGSGQFIKDLDNNKYLDLISSLGAVSLGYGMKSLNKKLINVIKLGNTFSLSHKKELELAKILTKLIPSAEMVRFGKNGTDVNSAAIRLARHITKRNHIAVCGYHGWQDWYIASTTMSTGVPNLTKKYTNTFEFNNIDSLKKIFSEKSLAAVIMEPFSTDLPNKKFLNQIRYLCDQNKTLLIFDEVCTGFRVNLSGAQKILKVTPDLSTFGKAMANGYPISALVGKKKYMKEMQNIFYSGTFGGEILSIEACIQTIKFMKKNNTIQKNIEKGKFLKSNLYKSIKHFKLSKYIAISGHPSWLFLKIKNFNEKNSLVKTFIMEKLIKNKILFSGYFNINYSHNIGDLKRVCKIFHQALSEIKEKQHKLDLLTRAKIPKIIFQVRKS
jgi:glutamate-1-semialdehyde 2,1-aminomutase